MTVQELIDQLNVLPIEARQRTPRLYIPWNLPKGKRFYDLGKVDADGYSHFVYIDASGPTEDEE